MKTFLEFLTEVIDLPRIDKKSKLWGTGHYLNKSEKLIKNHGFRHLSTMKNGDDVYHGKDNFTHDSFIFDVPSHVYHVVDKKTRKVKATLTSIKSGKSEHIHNLVAIPGSQTHHLYHHLITHHGKILQTSSQSHGGYRVWQKLAKMKGINIHGWYRGKPVNVDPKLKHKEETHATSKESSTDPNVRHIYHTRLIAHKQ